MNDQEIRMKPHVKEIMLKAHSFASAFNASVECMNAVALRLDRLPRGAPVTEDFFEDLRDVVAIWRASFEETVPFTPVAPPPDPLASTAKIRDAHLTADDQVECPHCGACAGLSSHGTETTMVGWNGFGPDPNHKHTRYTCSSCLGDFNHETKSGRAWYTKGALVIRGRHGCFEQYDYPCRTCPGTVTRVHLELDGITPLKTCGLSSRIVDGKRVRDYRTAYICGSCHASVEVDE